MPSIRLLAALAAALVLGCAAPKQSKSLVIGPFEIKEQVSSLETPDPNTAREEALSGILATAMVRDADSTVKVNAALAPFGYEVKKSSGGTFDLYQGQRLVRGGFSFLRQPSVAASGNDFVMAIGHAGDQVWLLRPGGLQEWDFLRAMWVPPVFAGDRLVAVSRAGSQAVVVTADGKEAYRQEVPAALTQYPVKRLDTNSGQWVLELLAEIVVEGKALPYEESFGWAPLGGKPFHFVRQNGTYGVVYDGKRWPLGYEKIICNACCEASRYNPVLAEDGAAFFAYKDKAWRFVTLRLKS